MRLLARSDLILVDNNWVLEATIGMETGGRSRGSIGVAFGY